MTGSPIVQRVAVIGGGITGLAAAHRLIELADAGAHDADVLLFEASDRLGGVFGTRIVDGYTVETGADSFITNKPWAVDLCRRLGIAHQLIGTCRVHQQSLILLDGKAVPTPEGFELVLPRQLKALLASPFLSDTARQRVAAEAYVPPRVDQSDESLADFVRRRFGQEALERIIQPLVGGIYTADPQRLSMQATLPRFVEMERQHGSLLRAVWSERTRPEAERAEDVPSGARYGLFATLAGGMSGLPDALENRVRQQARLCCSTPVTSVRPLEDGRYSVATPTKPVETVDAVILAIPSYFAAELIADWDPDLASQLRAIEYTSSAIVVSGHQLTDVRHPLDAFGLVVPHVERRRILAVSFISRKFPGRAPDGCVQLRTFVGGAMQPEVLDQSDDSLVVMVREELREILGVEGEPDFAEVCRWNRAMPQYNVGHLDRVAAIEAAAARHPHFALAGNAYRGVGIPDCIRSGEQAAEQVLASLRGNQA